MSFIDDFMDAAGFSFSWVNIPKVLMFAVLLFVLYLLPAAAFVFLSAPIFALLLAIFVYLAAIYIGALTFLEALRAKSLPAEKSVGISDFIEYLIVWFVTGLYAVFSVSNLKMLAIPLVSLLLFISSAYHFVTGFVANVFLALSFAGFITYFLVVMYNFVRVFFANIIYLSKEESVLESVFESSNLTDGRVARLFGFLLLYLLPINLAITVLSLFMIGVFFVPIVQISSIFFFVAVYSLFLNKEKKVASGSKKR